MIRRALVGLLLVVAFAAGVCEPSPSAADRDYVATGTLHLSSENAEKQVCEFRIGNATDARRKLLIVSTPDMAIAQACREHAGDHASLTLRFAADFKASGSLDGRP